MTLLEKYEDLKKKGVQDPSKILDIIIGDLHNAEDHPSVATIHDEILKKISEALTENNPDGALTWARTLQTLPN